MKVTTDSCLFGAWVANEIKQATNILDIGAGTGLLGMMIAQKHNSTIDAIEIEPGCFKQLKENIENNKWVNNFNLHLGDIREFKPSTQFDLIISNPPFYENQLNAENKSVNLARHSNALNLIELFEAAQRMLDQKGYFYALLPAFRKEECIEVASRYQLYPTSIAQVKQTPSHTFFRTMMGFSREKNDNPVLKEISIKNTEGNYSDQFIELLSEYYLNL